MNHASKESPTLRLNSQSQHSKQIDDDADIGDEIHLANMAFINAAKTGHHHHHQEQQRSKTTETHGFSAPSYGSPNEEEDEGSVTMAMNDS